MADTQRSLADIIALLANNTAGDISAQDMRDVVETLRMRAGQLSIPEVAGADVTISNTTAYFEVTAPTWTAFAGNDGFDESAGNGRLTYKGAADVMLHIACTISVTTGSNNQVLHVMLAKNGVVDDASEVIFKLLTGNDERSTAMHMIASASTGDYFSIKVRNATSAVNVRFECANLQAVSMPK
jgi:hypothetical protein